MARVYADSALGFEQTATCRRRLYRPYLEHQLARIYILAGEHEKALDRLEPLLGRRTTSRRGDSEGVLQAGPES